jgi:hypothetical protein
MKEFIKDIFRQLVGLTKPREGAGDILFSQLTVNRMKKYGLTGKTLVNVFRFGIEKKPGMIIQEFYEYSVGIYYKYGHAEGKYIITTCWKAS